MKELSDFTFSIEQCKRELEEFTTLLRSKATLKERDEILPFFKEKRHLAAFIGTYIPDIAIPDKIATEYDIFGDFICDLIIGASKAKAYLLVEFEDADSNSLFIQKNRSTPEWAPRLEHGFSQVIDWFWKLSDMEKTDDYENRFGARHVTIHGLVVVGRDHDLQKRERERLKWRQDHTIVHSKKISVITFDQLARDIEYRLTRYQEAAQVDRN
jgi:hypothetical protein